MLISNAGDHKEFCEVTTEVTFPSTAIRKLYAQQQLKENTLALEKHSFKNKINKKKRFS